MKLSTKGRYGLRAVLDISLHQQNGPVTISSIAERQDLSERYLEQLLVKIKHSGIIKSLRGIQGGYLLNKEPSDITVGDVIRALEGPIAPVECVGEKSLEPCSRVEICITKKIWEELKDAMNKVLDSYTLADLMVDAEKFHHETTCDFLPEDIIPLREKKKATQLTEAPQEDVT